MDDPIKRGRELIARLDRIPVWPYPKKTMLIVGIGFFFAFYDIVSIGLVLPDLQREFSVSLTTASWCITSGLLGYIIGSFIVSRIADIFGRRLSLQISVMAFTLGSLFCAVSNNIQLIIIFRFISGMGIGAEIAAVTAYMQELAPGKIRGQSTSTAIAFGMIGFAVVPFLALLLLPHFTFGWRILFLIGALGGILIFIMRKHLPESPRWLLMKGDMQTLENDIIKLEKYAVQTYGTSLPEPSPIINYPFSAETSLRELLHYSIMKRIVLFVVIWFFYYIGNYSWLTLSTTLFIQKGYTLANSIAFVALSSLGFVFGSIATAWMSDKIDRRNLAFTIAIIWTIALLIIGWFPRQWSIVIFGFIATTTIGMIIPIMYIITGENFPTRIRTTCLAVTDGLGHIGGAFCAQITFGLAGLFPSIQFSMSFTIMAITGLITAFLLLKTLHMTQTNLSELSNPQL